MVERATPLRKTNGGGEDASRRVPFFQGQARSGAVGTMTAREITTALGSACRSGHWWRCRCPVHGSRGPTLALRDGERGLVVKCHAGCSRDDIFAELRRRGLGEGGDYDRGRVPLALSQSELRIDRDIERRVAMARQIWEAARDARGTPVERYLANRRITIPPPLALRWAARCWHPSGICLPAMVARVDSLDGELIGVHRTYLNRDHRGRWHRRDRASLGPVGSGAVRLAPVAETLLIGEGIETCMAAMQAILQPAWAALSTSGMTALTPPVTVGTIIILADHDSSGAGERAARTAADRWCREGWTVRLAMPPVPGTDFADVLAGRTYARIAEVGDAAA
jgi:putative DNA primase/helicase